MQTFAGLWLAACLIALSLGVVRSETIETIEESNSNVVQVKELKKKTKVLNSTLVKNTVHVYRMALDKSDIMDLIRVAAEVQDPSEYENQKGTILEVEVSNGADAFLLKLPVSHPNLTLYSDGKLLNPLLPEDFGPQKKRKKNGNSTITQNLIIKVQSRLNEDLEYTLHITRLDRSQYYLKFKEGESSKILANQHLTFVKPTGFYLNALEQNVHSFHITVTSDDDICASLITIPANESIYDRRVDIEDIDNRRILSFTRRADVFFSNAEIRMFNSFRIFVMIGPTNTGCSLNATRKIFNENKKISFEFTKLQPTSYSYPIFLMILFFATPTLILIPTILPILRKSSTESQLISFSENSSPNTSIEQHAPQQEIIVPEEEILQIQEPQVGSKQDSLTLHGQMLQYPVALILPVLMHTAVEYHKWTTSTMANRDEMCFHNHACARPYGEFRAWNNIISILGYALYGLIFIAVTMCRRRRQEFLGKTGTFECTLLDVTIGVFMVLQAVASATYHICPSDVAFQFDTPCIQVICGLLIIRQWLTRVESPSPAYTNILLFGVVSLNFLISAFSRSEYVRYMIAGIHVTIISGICLTKRKMLSGRQDMARNFIIFFSALNVLTILFYLASTEIHLNQISTYCFIVNCIMYIAYYSAMKVVHRENIGLKAKVCGSMAVVGWLLAGFFFFQDDTDWTRTAAESRALNRTCLLLNFFGSHDLWHIFGALAGLFTFLFVSFVDDDLLNTPRPSVNLF